MSEPLQAAWVLYELRRFDRAAGAARDALGSDPEDPAAHALLGLSLAAQADELRGAGAVGKAARLRTDAVTAAREAVRLDPAAAIGWYALATVLGGSGGDGAAAEAAAAEAVRLDAADPVALALVAHARLQQSDAAGALAAAEQALALDPGNRAAAQVRAVALSLLGHRGSSDAASEVLADRPEDADAWVVHGLVALYGGRYGEAAAALGEGLRLDPADDQARGALRLARWGGRPVAAVPVRALVLASRLMAGARGPVGRLGVLAGIFVLAIVAAAALIALELGAIVVLPGTAALVVLVNGLLLCDRWFLDALRSLLLRRRLGRMAPLDPAEEAAARWGAFGLVATAACVVVALTVGGMVALPLSLVAAVVTVAGTGVGVAVHGRQRAVLAGCTAALAAPTAAVATLAAWAGAGRHDVAGLFLLCFTVLWCSIGLGLVPPLLANLTAPPPVGVALAGRLERVAALLVDLGLQGALAVVSATVALAVLAATGWTAHRTRFDVAATVATAVGIPQYLFSIWNLGLRQGPRGGGRSLGKRALGLRLVSRHDGLPPSNRVAVVRWAIRTGILFGGYTSVLAVSWLWPLWDRQRQTLEDKLLGTIVVRDDRLARAPVPS